MLTGQFEEIDTDGCIADWLVDNFEAGDAFSVFSSFKPSQENCITFNEAELMKDGEFIVLDTPADAVTAAFIIVSVVLAVAVVALTPKPELPENINRQQESPNNQLSSRSNQARPLQRIPDIKGQVLSIPDVIMPAYSIYEDNKEIEHGYYCVGRGQYQLDSLKDGDTPIELISGSGVEIYYPNHNPNTSPPDETIGIDIERDIYIPQRSPQASDLTLVSDFAEANYTKDKIMVYTIEQFKDTNFFVVPNQQTGFLLSPSSYPVGSFATFIDMVVGGVDVSGTWEVNYSSETAMHLKKGFPSLPQIPIKPTSGEIEPDEVQEFTDWFYLTSRPSESAIVNVVAPFGMYKDDGSESLNSTFVDYEIQFQEVDDNDNLVGAIMTVNGVIDGDNQKQKGKTTEYNFISDGGKASAIKFACRAKRTTPRDTTFNGQVVDEIRLKDVYALANIESNHEFGDVTTIQTKTTATPFATSVKERQLSCIATEMLEPYIDENTQGPLAPNTNAIQSFITDSLDPVIGNRTSDEIDIQGLLDLNAEIDSYFGNDNHTNFSYTFDSTDISYQDYAQTVFNAINCIAYREGSVIKAIFERPQLIPAMLFTHRSKIPDSESYTRNFNRSEIPDGVEFNWTDPDTDTTETIYIPSDKSAVNPKQFNIAGIRNFQQATIRANREYNKIRNQKLAVDIVVTAEGRYVRPMDMISIVKGTRVNTFDGEVIAVNNLTLTLSQDVEFTLGDIHSITLKNDDGTTDNILCNEGAAPNEVILVNPPQQTIRTGIDSRRTEFSFGNEARKESQRWLAQEIDLTDKLNVTIKAINYSDEYYAGDGVNLKAFSDGFDDGFS